VDVLAARYDKAATDDEFAACETAREEMWKGLKPKGQSVLKAASDKARERLSRPINPDYVPGVDDPELDPAAQGAGA
jgi:hypothetical protein